MEMRVVQRKRGKAALPEVSPPTLAKVDPPGVAAGRLAEPLVQAVAGLGDQRGSASGNTPNPGYAAVFGHQILVGLVVLIAKKGLLAPVAPLRHMMRQPRRHNPCQTCHATMHDGAHKSSQLRIVSPEPNESINYHVPRTRINPN